MSQYPSQPGMAPQYGAGAPITEDPGRTLGIIGLVVSIFASLIGLIISIIAYNKSKAAGLDQGQDASAGHGPHPDSRPQVSAAVAARRRRPREVPSPDG